MSAPIAKYNDTVKEGSLLNAKLQAGESLGQPVNHLLLDRDGQSLCCGRHFQHFSVARGYRTVACSVEIVRVAEGGGEG